jgi:hypothetical protein
MRSCRPVTFQSLCLLALIGPPRLTVGRAYRNHADTRTHQHESTCNQPSQRLLHTRTASMSAYRDTPANGPMNEPASIDPRSAGPRPRPSATENW